jgi:predicted nucleic acid-binding protein
VIVLVDTSVWIEYLRGTDAREAQILHHLLEDEADLCICGPVLTEVLQGVKDDRQYARTKTELESLIYLPLRKERYLDAAALYRNCRKRGETVRNPIDCVIAACAIFSTVPILHRDRDFETIARHSSLRLLPSV